jgi:hypothetical protein
MKRRKSRGAAVIVGIIVMLSASCASLDVDRETATSGTFTSTALSFTLLSFDMPAPALSVARANAADSGRPELIVRHETVFPYLGVFDWILDLISVRYARVTGTWGTPPE